MSKKICVIGGGRWGQSHKENDYILITEETTSYNDNKLFIKTPFICNELEIKTKTLPELIQMLEEVSFEIKIENESNTL